MTSLGKYRHLDRCATPDGHFVILAIDHRANLMAELNKHAPQPVSEAEFMAFKEAVITTLAPEASGVLTDPAYGISHAIPSRSVHGRHGLLAPVEVTNYDLHPRERMVEMIPDWSVAKIKRMGGDGVKLLLPYHPDADNAEKLAIVAQIVEECATHDIPFFLEPVAYTLAPQKPLTNAELLEISVEMAQRFSTMGVDVLKLQFPVDDKQSRDEDEWREACRAVDAACTVPWALLSGGTDFDTFAQQARIACQCGASGVIVGRAVWKEAISLHAEVRTAFLKETGIARMRQLSEICAAYARPWTVRTPTPPVRFDWYMG